VGDLRTVRAHLCEFFGDFRSQSSGELVDKLLLNQWFSRPAVTRKLAGNLPQATLETESPKTRALALECCQCNDGSAGAFIAPFQTLGLAALKGLACAFDLSAGLQGKRGLGVWLWNEFRDRRLVKARTFVGSGSWSFLCQ
jgi:hypothetical protein